MDSSSDEETILRDMYDIFRPKKAPSHGNVLSSQWACETCTYLNAPSARVCSMCGAERAATVPTAPFKHPTPAPLAPSNPYSRAPVSKSTARPPRNFPCPLKPGRCVLSDEACVMYHVKKASSGAASAPPPSAPPPSAPPPSAPPPVTASTLDRFFSPVAPHEAPPPPPYSTGHAAAAAGPSTSVTTMGSGPNPNPNPNVITMGSGPKQPIPSTSVITMGSGPKQPIPDDNVIVVGSGPKQPMPEDRSPARSCRPLELIEEEIDRLCATRASCKSKSAFAADMRRLLDERDLATLTVIAPSPEQKTSTDEGAAAASPTPAPPEPPAVPEQIALMRQLSEKRVDGSVPEDVIIQLKTLVKNGQMDTARALLEATMEDREERMQSECEVCFDMVRKDNMCQIACARGHTYCWDCAQETVKGDIQSQVVPKCPGFDDCKHTLTGPEVKYVLGRGQYTLDGVLRDMMPEWTAYNDFITKHALSQNQCMVTCPKCEYPVECALPKAVPQKVDCPRPSCRHVYCSACTRLYHYQVDCARMRSLTLNWHDWIQNGRHAFLTEVALVEPEFHKFAAAKQKHDQDTLDRIRRHEELVAAEKLLAQRCRLCPKCGKAIEKVDGCDSMKCGQDYHGGNNQAGCGHSFNWNHAKPYKAEAGDFKAMDPFAKIAPQHASRSVHFIDRERSLKMRCDVCSKDIVGPRFSCVHCPGDNFNICFRCEAQGDLRVLHNPEHVFMIHMGDSVSGVDWSNK